MWHFIFNTSYSRDLPVMAVKENDPSNPPLPDLVRPTFYNIHGRARISGPYFWWAMSIVNIQKVVQLYPYWYSTPRSTAYPGVSPLRSTAYPGVSPLWDPIALIRTVESNDALDCAWNHWLEWWSPLKCFNCTLYKKHTEMARRLYR